MRNISRLPALLAALKSSALVYTDVNERTRKVCAPRIEREAETLSRVRWKSYVEFADLGALTARTNFTSPITEIWVPFIRLNLAE